MCLYINFNIAQEKNSKKVTLGSLASGHLLGGTIKPQKVYFLIKQEIPKYTAAIYQKGEGFVFVCFQSSLKMINDPGLQGRSTNIYFKSFHAVGTASKQQPTMLHHQTELLLWVEKEAHLMEGLTFKALWLIPYDNLVFMEINFQTTELNLKNWFKIRV